MTELKISLSCPTKFLQMFKIIPSSLYGALMLFLFLPFIQIKCNDTVLAESTGAKVAMGAKPTFKDTMMESYISSQTETMDKLQKENKPNIILIVFALVVLLGFLFTLATKRDLELGNTVFSAIAAAALLGFMIQIMNGNNEIGKQMEGMKNGFMKMDIGIKLAYGYWLSLATCVLILVFSSIMLVRKKSRKAVPIQIIPDEDIVSGIESQL
jgi:hypothetical protein